MEKQQVGVSSSSPSSSSSVAGGNKSRYKLLKLLPKATTGLNLHNYPPYSPARDHHPHHHHNNNKLKSHMNKGFSAPIISIIPVEARNKSKNSLGSFDDQTKDPTSPKVSCMGQIKHRKKIAKMKKRAAAKPSSSSSSSSKPNNESKFKRSSSFLSIFGKGRRASETTTENKPVKGRGGGGGGAEVAAPSLGQMKRFVSGRDSLGSFDWTKAEVAPDNNDRRYYSEDERGVSDGELEDEGDEEEEDVIIPFSAPIMVGGGTGGGGGGGGRISVEPKKEINIWKRRTMAQPRPLQLNTSY